MRRVTEEELSFYDRLAERISILLGHPHCPLTQSSLAERIGWNRASLCNFLNRIDKSIAAHFVPKIARTLQVPLEQLMSGIPAPAIERTCWDPRWDEPQVMLDKMAEWKRRKLSWISLRRTLPACVMPNRGMLVNYVDSSFDGASPVAAERWHELAESREEGSAADGEGECLHLMFMRDLVRIPERMPPYHGFSSEEIVLLLEHLKKEWVRHRNFRLIAAADSAWSPDVRLEMAGNECLTVVGREVRIEHRNDFRVHWSEDPKAVALTRECLVRVKRSGGLGVREDPRPQEAQRVIDDLLSKAEAVEESRCGERASTPLAANGFRARRRSAAFAALSGLHDGMVDAR
jgi:transcriptional regulator with XRE-family HTH domain